MAPRDKEPETIEEVDGVIVDEEDFGEEAEVVVETEKGIVSAGPIKLREFGISGGISDLATVAQMQKALEVAKMRTELIHDLRVHAISLTTKHDWEVLKRESDNADDVAPYLRGTGALKLRDPMRVDLDRDRTPEIVVYKQGRPDEYWGAVFHGRARCMMFSPLWMYVDGARYSNEKFFTRAGKIEANPGHIIKAAATNWSGNAIRKAIGLEAPEWSWLEAAGLDVRWIRGQAKGFRDDRQAAKRRGDRAQKDATFTVDMLAVKLDKDAANFETKKSAIKNFGGRFNLDGSFRWFLEDNDASRSMISAQDLIGQTTEIKANA